MQNQISVETLSQLSSIRNDEGLKELLRIYLAEPDRAHPEGEAGSLDLNPALLGPYRELETIRYGFPVVLVEDDADTPIVALAAVLDAALERAAPADGEGERLRRQVYRLETSIKRLAEKHPNRRLSELWSLASNELVRQSENPEPLRASLEAAAEVLVHDGRLLACGTQSTRQIFEHAWQPLQSERAVREREIVDELIARLSEVLESERARSPKSTSPEALEAAFGGEHAGGIDFESLSSVLRGTRHGRVMPAKRSKRLRVARKVLENERALQQVRGGDGVRRRRDRRRASVCESCAEAMDRFDSELQRGVELIRAARVANLELENRYREKRHDRFFETFDAGQLTPAEYSALPPLLVYLNGDTLSDAEKSTLVQILASDMPVKVVLEVHELPASDSANAPPGTFTEWTRQIAGMAVSLGEAFVMQTAASHLPQLATDIIEGLRCDGPALFCVYVAPDQPQGGIPHYLRCASAVESRAFPSFVYCPARGTDWASRFFLAGSAQCDRDWPEHHFSYESADGKEEIENLAYTCVDFLALDARFLQHFVEVPRERWHANMMPVARYLTLTVDETFDKVPYVYLVDGQNHLHRVIVRRALLTFARKCLNNWRNLQELAGVNNSHALRLLEQERARLYEESHRAAEEPVTVQPLPTETPATETTPAEEAPAVQTVATADSGQPYIESVLCTSCDDCIQRNASMFAYDDVKQAYIKDPSAGSYRDMVEAAENCPVCIIHPGKPLDPSEPNLDELQQRAAAFN
ncbi:MAG: ferredoxin [Gammaproteobacteria bacterium]|nr:ferredoxin [Gammaproteobacteria bacterium]